ncbi:UNVERIFIED_CONTAM: hypothetical protein Sradi_4281500 [Sesamum radiatum]|uniref:Copper transport protein n=1 Tax=Sesamum radiatum TaxID=300843 RepID=A0AAW2NNB1_SESRA
MTMPMPMSPPYNNQSTTNMDGMGMHMSFFWGKDVVVLFAGWPGSGRLGISHGSSYLIMLSVMSFNIGIFVAVVAGHAVGSFVVKYRALTAVARAVDSSHKLGCVSYKFGVQSSRS